MDNTVSQQGVYKLNKKKKKKKQADNEPLNISRDEDLNNGLDEIHKHKKKKHKTQDEDLNNSLDEIHKHKNKKHKTEDEDLNNSLDQIHKHKHKKKKHKTEDEDLNNSLDEIHKHKKKKHKTEDEDLNKSLDEIHKHKKKNHKTEDEDLNNSLDEIHKHKKKKHKTEDEDLNNSLDEIHKHKKKKHKTEDEDLNNSLDQIHKHKHKKKKHKTEDEDLNKNLDEIHKHKKKNHKTENEDLNKSLDEIHEHKKKKHKTEDKDLNKSLDEIHKHKKKKHKTEDEDLNNSLDEIHKHKKKKHTTEDEDNVHINVKHENSVDDLIENTKSKTHENKKNPESIDSADNLELNKMKMNESKHKKKKKRKIEESPYEIKEEIVINNFESGLLDENYKRKHKKKQKGIIEKSLEHSKNEDNHQNGENNPENLKYTDTEDKFSSSKLIEHNVQDCNKLEMTSDDDSLDASLMADLNAKVRIKQEKQNDESNKKSNSVIHSNLNKHKMQDNIKAGLNLDDYDDGLDVKLEMYDSDHTNNDDKKNKEIKDVLTDEDKEMLRSLHIQLTWNMCEIHHLIPWKVHYPKSIMHIKDLGLEYKIGRFTKAEDEIIKQTFQEFCKIHGIKENGIPFIHAKQCHFRRSNEATFYQFIAKNLPNRLVPYVFTRFTRLYKNYNYGSFTANEDSIIMDVMSKIEGISGKERNRQIQNLSLTLNREINLLYCHYTKIQLLQEEGVSNSARGLDHYQFIQAVVEHAKIENMEDLKEKTKDMKYLIFVDIGKQLNIAPAILFRRWYTIVYPMIFLEIRDRSEIKKMIINFMIEDKVTDLRDIDFKKYANNIEGSTENFIAQLINEMKQMTNCDNSVDNVQEILHFAREILPSKRSKIKKIDLTKIKFVKKSKS